MTPSTSPTWYDVLGVSPQASTEQIKQAWREATDRFEPGSASGQFRMYNEAADVLLDPRRRAEYDATLARPGHAEATAPGLERSPALPETHRDMAAERRARKEARRNDRKAEEPVARSAPDEQSGPSRRALVLTAVLALLTVAALVAAGWLALQVREDSRVAEARREAPAAAEQAAEAMLSYDYRTLPADRQRAGGYLTSAYRKKYLETFKLLERNKDGSPGAAVQTKTVVKADVMGSGVVDAEEEKVRVLVFVNQTSRKEGSDPQIFQNRVAMTMVEQGNRWLVNNLQSY